MADVEKTIVRDRATPCFIGGLGAGFLTDLYNSYYQPATADVVTYMLLIGTAVLLAGAVAFALLQRHTIYITPGYRAWLLLMTAVSMILLAYGFVRQNEMRLIGPDTLIYLYLFAGILVGVNAGSWPKLDRFLTLQFAIAAVLSAASWLSLGVSLSEGRQAVQWTKPYLLWGTMFAWPYFLLTFNEGAWPRRVVVMFGIAVFFVMALFFEKRTPFAHLALLAGCALYGATRTRQSLEVWARAAVVLAIMAVCVWGALTGLDEENYASISASRLEDRFLERGTLYATVAENDRLTDETAYVWEELGGVELLFGRGFGGSVLVPNGIYGLNRVGWLHNGTATLVLKGGTLLFALWTLGWLGFAARFFTNRDPRLFCYYIPVIIVLSLSFLESFATYNPSFGFLMACAGRCMAGATSPLGVRSRHNTLRPVVSQVRVYPGRSRGFASHPWSRI